MIEAADVAVALTVLASAFVQSALGFGFGLVAMAVVPHWLPIRFAVPFVAVFGLLLTLTLALRYRDAIDRPAVPWLFAGGLLGVPVGVHALQTVDPVLLVRTLGGVVLVYALLGLLSERGGGARGDDPVRPWWGAPAGLLGGVLSGAINTGGPPVIAYGRARGWAARPFRGTLCGYFAVVTSLQLVLFQRAELLTHAVWQKSLAFSPFVLVGLLLGARLGDRIDPPRFRRVVLWALVALSGTLLLR